MRDFGFDPLPDDGPLNDAIALFEKRFFQFLETGHGDLEALFGPSLALDALIGDWSANGPDTGAIAVVSGDQLGADAGYAAEIDTIFIADTVLGGGATVERLVDILAEEMGHRIDARVNAADTAGDEGRAFALLMRGERADQPEDDTGTATIDGFGTLALEHAVSVSDSGGFEGSSKTLILEGTEGGEITYSYTHYTIPDRFIIRYEGTDLFDTGFTGGSKSGTIPLPAGSSKELQIIVATDNAGTAWNYSVSVESEECKAPAPWIVTSLGEDFEKNDKTMMCEADASITVGRSDGTAALFRAAGTPKVEFNKTQMKISGGTIYSSHNGISQSLFYADEIGLSFTNGRTTLAGVQQGGFKLAGLPVEFKSMSVLSDRLAFDVDFTLPDWLGLIEIATDLIYDDALHITATGAHPVLGFKLDPPGTFEKEFFGKLKASVSGINLEYRAQDDALRFQSKFVLENTKFAEDGKTWGFKSLEADLSGPNYVQVNSDGDVDIIGAFKVAGRLGPWGGWALQDLGFTVNTVVKELGFNATVLTPFGLKFLPGPTVAVTFEMVYSPDWAVDRFKVVADQINRPLPGNPLVFFQSFGVGFDGLATPDPAFMEFTLAATLGPQIKGARLARTQYDGKVNTSMFDGTATTDFATLKYTYKGEEVGPFSLLKDSSQLVFDWSKGTLKFVGTTTALDGLFTSTGTFTVDSGFNFGFSRKAEVAIPNFVPKFGGTKLGNGNVAVSFTNDGNSGNDYVAAWGTFRINTPVKTFDITFGARASFDGTVQMIGADNIPKTNSWFIEGGQEYVVLMAYWQTPSANAAVYVEKPDGTIVQEADFAAHGIYIVNELTDNLGRAVIIDTPAEGVWDLQLVSEAGLGSVTYEATGATNSPGFDFTGSPVAAGGGVFTYSFSVAMDATVATVSFFYDDDLTELDGMLAGTQTVTNGAGNFVWDSSLVLPGTYYLYAMVDDGAGPITIVEDDDTVTTGTQADVGVTMQASALAAVPGETIRYTIEATNNSGTETARGVMALLSLPAQVTYAASSVTADASAFADYEFDLGDIAPGATASFTVDVSADAALAADDQLGASVYITSETYDPETLNDTASVEMGADLDTGEGGRADLRVISNLGDGREGTATEAFSYVVVVKNTGTGTATGAQLTEFLTNLSDVTMNLPFTQSGNLYTVELGDLAPGQAATVLVSGTAASPGLVKSVSTARSAVADENLADNEDFSSAPVRGPEPDPADLSLDLRLGTPGAGGAVTLSVDLTNAGPGIASSIEVGIDLPAGVVVQSHNAVQGSYDTGTGVWNVGNMRDALTRTLNLTLSGTNGGIITAEVIAVDEADPDSTPNDGTGDDWAQTLLAFYGDTITGTADGEFISGTSGDDHILGLGGDDTLAGSRGIDRLDGGAGQDEAWMLGYSHQYTVQLTPGATYIHDRVADRDEIDHLIGIEGLNFIDGVIPLDAYDGVVNVSAADLVAFVEMYIAYFNRAPDAQGLYFWASFYAAGLSLSEIAGYFFDGAEASATYPNPADTGGFVQQVYNNVLGRNVDQGGFDFWKTQLDLGNVAQSDFIVAVLAGAKLPAAPGSSQAVIDQKAADVAYLEGKTDLGLYYAVIKGMSDADDARDAMALYDGSAAGLASSKAAIDGHYADALDLSTGDFLMQLVGVVDDPFAV